MNTHQQISSTENPKFKQVRALLSQARQRKKSGTSVLEGVHLLHSYWQKGFTPQQIWLSEQTAQHPEVQPLLHAWQGVPTFLLEQHVYKQLRSVGEGVDVLAVIAQPTFTLGSIQTDALVLDNVQDVGNVGTLLRTAAAVGIKHILCTTGTASCWSPKCLRAGMGAQFSLSIYENLATHDVLAQVQVPLLATSSHTQGMIYQQDLTQPLAWIMGNEGQGVAASLLENATAIALPQPHGEESLNVAIAGALCMYETLRQREYAG